MKIFPKKSNAVTVQRELEKTPGPHGKSIDLSLIPRRTVMVLHEHRPHTTPRYKDFGGVANRAARRAYARGRGVDMPGATLEPYEPTVGQAPISGPHPVF